MKNPVKIVIFLVIAGLFVAGAEYLDRTDGGRKFNEQYFLEMLVGTAEGVGNPEVTYVAVNQGEKDQFGGWPPPRLDWGVILNLLGHGSSDERAKLSDNGVDPGVKFHDSPVVGVAASLNWPEEDSNILAVEVMKERALLLASLVNGAALGPEGAEGAKPVDAATFATIDQVEGDVSQLPDAGAAVETPDSALEIAGVNAFTHIELADLAESSENGVKIPLLARFGESVLAGFALQVVLEAKQLDESNVSVKFADGAGVIDIAGEDGDGNAVSYSIPIDERGRMLVYHGVRVAELYPKLDAAVDLILASSDYEVAEQVRAAKAEEVETLKSNAVVIGFDHEAAKQFELPTGDKVSRSELMAMAVATIQSGRFVQVWPSWMRYAVLAVVVLVCALLIPTRALSRGNIFIGLVLAFGYFALSLVTFQTNLTWTPPLAGIGVCLAFIIAGWILPKPKPKPAAAGGGDAEAPANDAKKEEPKAEEKAETKKEEEKLAKADAKKD
ncbi:MAG: CHASE2 domain-containing protein [Verrucomicrobiota bacterium]